MVIGPLLPPAGGRWPTPWTRWEARTLERQYAEMLAGAWAASPRQFYTGNASVRREHLVELGGFDAGLRRAEDVELGFRLRDRGLRFLFEPEAAGFHDARRSYRSWLRAARQYGAVDALLGLRRGRRDVLESAARELGERHPVTRACVRWTLGRRRVAALLPWAAVPLAWAAFLAGRGGLADQVCGGVFNVLYWQGMCDGLGGAAAARNLVRTGSVSHEPAAPAGSPAGGAR